VRCALVVSGAQRAQYLRANVPLACHSWRWCSSWVGKTNPFLRRAGC